MKEAEKDCPINHSDFTRYTYKKIKNKKENRKKIKSDFTRYNELPDQSYGTTFTSIASQFHQN